MSGDRLKVRVERFLSVFKRYRGLLPWVSRASGVLLILVGILLVSGSFATLSAIMASWTPDFLLDRM